MKDTAKIYSYIFGCIVIVIGILNVILVDYRPGLLFMLLSLLYFVPMNCIPKNKSATKIINIAKIFLAIVIIWFTLGISDLGDVFDSMFIR